MIVSTPELERWLEAKGADRDGIIRQATETLLGEYSRQWIRLVPIELHRLAATLQAKIVNSTSLKGEALLVPVRSGFRVMVSSRVSITRYRTSVAHELVHTLFYDAPCHSTPVRLVPHTMEEEHFCFDVARHVLAPKEHLHAIGVFNDPDPEKIMYKLTDTLLLSRPLAARIMLRDFRLAKGIAGRWLQTSDGWTPQYGASSASPDVTKQERNKMRTAIVRWLESGTNPPSRQRIVTLKERSGEGIFVLSVLA